MYNFSLTKYYNAKSIIHDINPFYKIICTLIFTILLLFTKNTLLLFWSKSNYYGLNCIYHVTVYKQLSCCAVEHMP